MDILDLFAEAGFECLEDAGDVEYLYVSNMTSGEFGGMAGVMNALPYDIAAPQERLAKATVKNSGNGAYETSGYGPDDLDVAELHDVFTILEFI